MICWDGPCRLLLALAAFAPLAIASPAHAMMGVGVSAGPGVHFATGGYAITANGMVDILGWGVGGHYWNQPTSSTTYLALDLRRNISPVPTLRFAPGVGVAMTGGTPGPIVMATAGFFPPLMPFALDASVGAAYLNNSMLLPYAAGLKLSLIPFTAFTARWRCWAGQGALAGTNGPEVGFEVGF